jgi:hypothetical protein
MAQFAPVGPHQLLSKLSPHNLGHFHLVLAHDVVAHPEEWKDLFPKLSTIIIDNSVIELGESASVDTILEAYNILRSSERNYNLVVVPPEVLNNPVETDKLFLKYYPTFHDKLDPATPLMYVLQGPSFHDTLSSVGLFRSRARARKYSRLTWVAIPRSIVQSQGTRMWVTLECLKLKLEKPYISIHLFGFSDIVEDDIMCAKLPGVASIDSAVPLRLGQQHRFFDPDHFGDQAGPRGDYWESPLDVTIETMSNIITVRRLIESNTDGANVKKFPTLKMGSWSQF